MLVIGSPPCTHFSTLQELNKFNQRYNEERLARFNDNLIKATEHIRFCIKLYRMQMGNGRYWLHEHPWSAKSWQIPEMEELLKDPKVQVAYADQCQFGLTEKISSGSDERGPAKKPGNLWAVARRLRRTCNHDHVHVKLEGGRAKAAALYPDELCMEMCKGFRDQIEYDCNGLTCLGELNEKELVELVNGMLETAERWVEEDKANEIQGSHGDLPPMTDEGRRAQDEDEHAVKQSSEPKPISQSDGHELYILREKIKKDILDKTRKALMKFNNDRERASSARNMRTRACALSLSSIASPSTGPLALSLLRSDSL